MSREFLTLIETLDGDPVAVERYTNTGAAVEFTTGGVTTTIPWHQVTRLRRVDVDALRRCGDPDDPADDLSDEVKAFYADLDDTDAYDDAGDEVPRSEDTAPEGGRTTAEMSGAAPGPADDGPGDGPAPDVDPKTGAGRARESGGDPSAKELRAWAGANSIDVPASGPVPESVKAAFAAAHTD